MEHIEYEVRVLEIDKDEMINRLNTLGATLVEDVFQRRYCYDFNPVDPNRWIRLRTNGKKVTLATKCIESAKIDGTREEEVVVSDFDSTNAILNQLGYYARTMQENKRIQYDLNGVEVDIDTWPGIPTYLEIEGKSEEEVIRTLNLLGIPLDCATALDVNSIFDQVYHMDGKANMTFGNENVEKSRGL